MSDSVPLRVGVAVLLTLVIFVAYRSVYAVTGGFPPDFGFSPERFKDVTLLYSILPGYFIAMSAFAQARTRQALACFPDIEINPHWLLMGLLGSAGMIYGLLDFRLVQDARLGTFWLEWALRLGSALLWASVGVYAGWRLGFGLAIARSARTQQVNIWDRERFRPVARMATLDVFITMGALALMPLQSLSSDFQWVYYRAGLIVGIPMGVLALLLPLLGIRHATARAKREALMLVNDDIKAHTGKRTDLELLLAHRERIRGLSSWPLDLRLLSRALFYLVIPPLAWVGAALVERLLEQMI